MVCGVVVLADLNFVGVKMSQEPPIALLSNPSEIAAIRHNSDCELCPLSASRLEGVTPILLLSVEDSSRQQAA